MEKHPLLFNRSNLALEVGCDEAGRGCLAGPVVAAAVILKNPIEGLNDSKKITLLQRKQLKLKIESEALSYAVAFVSPRRIDEINILNASIEAMHVALDGLSVTPEHILVDGNRFKPYHNVSHECIIRGDGIYQSIAAASILAKTYRDQYMDQLDVEFPVYGWKKNMGYPTKKHEQALLENGISIHHRASFGIVKTLLQRSLFQP
ncbi:MAG: Ribonuclease [Bacteroidota bacterium]|jgi:ribonuclease HII